MRRSVQIFPFQNSCEPSASFFFVLSLFVFFHFATLYGQDVFMSSVTLSNYLFGFLLEKGHTANVGFFCFLGTDINLETKTRDVKHFF